MICWLQYVHIETLSFLRIMCVLISQMCDISCTLIQLSIYTLSIVIMGIVLCLISSACSLLAMGRSDLQSEARCEGVERMKYWKMKPIFAYYRPYVWRLYDVFCSISCKNFITSNGFKNKQTALWIQILNNFPIEPISLQFGILVFRYDFCNQIESVWGYYKLNGCVYAKRISVHERQKRSMFTTSEMISIITFIITSFVERGPPPVQKIHRSHMFYNQNE